jgi:nicotinate-nucleotide--dimethylbenzimidazole phosphoribosyltransferase
MSLNELISRIQETNGKFAEEAQHRLDNLTKPRGSLGRLEEFAKQLVAITGEPMPVLDRKVVFTFAGDHGVADEGVSAFPKVVTRQMVMNFLNGGAGINVLARHAGAEVVVVDIGVEGELGFPGRSSFVSRKVVSGTRNMRRGPAMTREEAVACISAGADLAEEYVKMGYKIFATGEMGIANTSPASAITAVMTGRNVEEVTGRGTGIGDEAWETKVSVIRDAISVNRPDRSDPVDVLSKVGGAEIGGIAGLVMGAAAVRTPVVIDGFISTAGALIAYLIEPKTRNYMFAAHKSREAGHASILDMIGLRPILDLDLRLGEGTGAALAMTLIEGGLKIYREMATFQQASVSERI